MPANWRLLEAEIIRIARQNGFEPDESSSTGDKYIVSGERINLTTFAQELSERVEVKGGKS